MIFLDGSHEECRGGPRDDDRRPLPRLPVDPKGKATKKIASKKRKYPDAETACAAAVAEATERAERGGLIVVLSLQTSFHQKRGLHLSELSAFMVVLLGLS